MKRFFVGIDISKNWLDYAVCDENSELLQSGVRVDNSAQGIDELIRMCQKITEENELWFCVEHTGHHGLLLAEKLEKANLPYSAVPALEIKHSIGMTRGKTDNVDAERIARYAATHKNKLVCSKLPEEQLFRLKSYLSYRNYLVKVSQQHQNNRKSQLVINKTFDVSGIISDLEAKIKEVKNDIKKLDKLIEEILTSDPQIETNYKKITTVRGIGLIIAAYIIVHTKNFMLFENPRKFNCYAGLAPFPYSSGSSIRGKTKTSSLRNRNLKKLLFNGAHTAALYDSELKAYYKRKKAEGKAHLSVINAIACKLVYRVFAVVNRDEPFVNLVR